MLRGIHSLNQYNLNDFKSRSNLYLVYLSRIIYNFYVKQQNAISLSLKWVFGLRVNNSVKNPHHKNESMTLSRQM